MGLNVQVSGSAMLGMLLQAGSTLHITRHLQQALSCCLDPLAVSAAVLHSTGQGSQALKDTQIPSLPVKFGTSRTFTEHTLVHAEHMSHAHNKECTCPRFLRTTCCHTLRSSSMRTGLIRKSTAP